MLKLDRWDQLRFAVSLALVIGATTAIARAQERTLTLVQTLNKSELVYPSPFSVRGVVAVTTSEGVQLWDTRTNTVRANLPKHNKLLEAFFSSDGNTFVTSSKEKRGGIITRLWDAQTGQLRIALSGLIVFGPDGQAGSNVAITLGDKELMFWNADTGELKKTVSCYKGSFSRWITSHDGRLVAGYGGSKAILWETATGRLIAKLKPPQERDFIVPWYHDIEVDGAVFSPDSKILATTDTLNSIQLWDTDTGRMRAFLEGHGSTIYHVTFSRDGKQLASASRDGSAGLWDIETGKLKQRLKAGKEIAQSVRFNPAGTALAVGYHTQARLWDTSTSGLIAELTPHRDVNKLVLFGTYWDGIEILFSPDGRLLLTIGNKTIQVWNAITGDLITTLEGVHGPVSFSPDSKALAATGRKETVLIWMIE